MASSSQLMRAVMLPSPVTCHTTATLCCLGLKSSSTSLDFQSVTCLVIIHVLPTLLCRASSDSNQNDNKQNVHTKYYTKRTQQEQQQKANPQTRLAPMSRPPASKGLELGCRWVGPANKCLETARRYNSDQTPHIVIASKQQSKHFLPVWLERRIFSIVEVSEHGVDVRAHAGEFGIQVPRLFSISWFLPTAYSMIQLVVCFKNLTERKSFRSGRI